MVRGVRLRIAVLVLALSMLPALAQGQDPPCPEASEQRFTGTLPSKGTATFPVNLQPCETLMISVSFTAPDPWGAAVSFTLLNDAGTQLLNDNFGGGRGSYTRLIPGTAYPWIPPYRGTRGHEGLPFTARFSSIIGQAQNYTIVMTKNPRPGYNTGGTGFGNAPTSYPGSVYRGSIHQLEPGQFFKVHLEANEGFSVTGSMLGHPQCSNYWQIDLYDSGLNYVRMLANGSAIGGPIPYESTSYLNESQAPTDVYVKLFVRYFPIHDFVLSIKPSATTTIDKVGFKNDEQLRIWPDGPDVDPANNGAATWARTDNPNLPVAYALSTTPRLVATVKIDPPLHVDPVVCVRAKEGGTVISSVSGVTIPAAGGQIPVDLALNGQFVRPSGVARSTYSWNWEISFDDGATWGSIGSSGPHLVYWVYVALPRESDHTKITVEYAPFRDVHGQAIDQYLFDEALKRATDAIQVPTIDGDTIAMKITEAIGLGSQIKYDPGHPVMGHPLRAYDDHLALCADNARLLRGLLGSLGYSATTYFLWGGDGASHHVYKYIYTPGYYTLATLRAVKARHDKAGGNPHFTYHAVVLSPGGFGYDPSYGERYDSENPPIDETLADVTVGPFLTGAQAVGKLVVSADLGYTTDNEYGTGAFEYCHHDMEPQFAEFVSQDVPAEMLLGEWHEVTVTFKNTGWNKWSVGGGYHLTVTGAGWEAQDVALPYDVDPDGVVTFTFLVAPTVTGDLDFQCGLEQTGFGPFGAPSAIVSVHVSGDSSR